MKAIHIIGIIIIAVAIGVSGSMKGGKFHATNILLKCPSKYESEGKPSEFGEKKI